MERSQNKDNSPAQKKGTNTFRASLLALGVLTGGVSLGIDASLVRGLKTPEVGLLQGEYLDPSMRLLLKEWSRMNGNIEITYVSRDEWNKLGGDFLKSKGPRQCALFLPIDLQVFELIRVIGRIDQMTYRGRIPSDAQSTLLIGSLQNYAQTIRVQLSEEKDLKKQKKLQQALGNTLKMIEETGGNRQGMQNEQRKVTEGDLANEISYRLFSTTFSYGVTDLGDLMEVFTQSDFSKLSPEKQKKNQHLRARLSRESRLLRDKIRIETLKANVESARKNGKENQIVKAELDAVRSIHYALKEYPWNSNGSLLDSSVPSEILSTKHIACLGYSILAHSLLQEVGIRHHALILSGASKEGHSALRVYLSDNQEYYFDPQENGLILTSEGNGAKTVTLGNDTVLRSKGLMSQYIEGNSQNFLMADLFGTKGADLNEKGRYEEALIWLDKAMKLIPESASYKLGYAFSLFQLGRYEEALQVVNEAKNLEPENKKIAFFYRQILYRMKQK